MGGLFRWSSKWWPGVIPLVIFWAVAAWTNTGPLESDLAARSTATLKETLLDKSRIAVAERDVVRVTLSGSSPLPASKGRLLEAARTALGSVEVVDQMDLSRGAPPRF